MEKNRINGKWLFVIIWIFCFTAVSIIFLVKLDDIKTNLKNTRFFERLFGTTPEFIEKHVDKKERMKDELGKNESTNTVIKINKIGGDSGSVSGDDIPEISVEESVWSNTSDFSNEELHEELTNDLKNLIDSEYESNVTQIFPDSEFTFASSDENQEIVSESEIEKTQAEIEREIAIKAEEERFVPKSIPIDVVDAQTIEEELVTDSSVETSSAKLWFILVDSDGRITRKQCVRKIVKSTAPLTNNIKLLLQGPNSSELDSGCMSLIPNGTRLLTAIVKDGVAYLNFSKEFENNRIGVEGYMAQLQQIVFTSTEFATVKSIQILINGQKKDTLGDGVWIGSPLTRADFQ